eukprot:TRINITY_DN76771_c0_g1_i1.p1 TRINITY_DN76771_c0_g1~~TRINITY_DN76771_c0_g1_i1.p1  ORF type:complete len:146 (+),score=9.61 TRINITY_DN76771_c0_g1_i1:70-507(+)
MANPFKIEMLLHLQTCTGARTRVSLWLAFSTLMEELSRFGCQRLKHRLVAHMKLSADVFVWATLLRQAAGDETFVRCFQMTELDPESPVVVCIRAWLIHCLLSPNVDREGFRKSFLKVAHANECTFDYARILLRPHSWIRLQWTL